MPRLARCGLAGVLKRRRKSVVQDAKRLSLYTRRTSTYYLKTWATQPPQGAGGRLDRRRIVSHCPYPCPARRPSITPGSRPQVPSKGTPLYQGLRFTRLRRPVFTRVCLLTSRVLRPVLSSLSYPSLPRPGPKPCPVPVPRTPPSLLGVLSLSPGLRRLKSPVPKSTRARSPTGPSGLESPSHEQKEGEPP